MDSEDMPSFLAHIERQQGRYWSCIGCGNRYDFSDAEHWRNKQVVCGKCNVGFDPLFVPTGDEPLPFGERLNRLLDGE